MRINALSQRHIVFMYDGIFADMFLNIHVIVGKRYSFIIDTGMGSEHAKDVRDYLMKQDRVRDMVVINTHEHWDHIWGNGFFDAQWIIAHQKCRQAMDLNWDADVRKLGHRSQGKIKKRLPNLLFDSTLEFAEEGIVLGYAPGHTDNDIYVYDAQEKILNVGDNIGDTDAEPIPELTLSGDEYRRSIELYQSLDCRHVVSGHNRIQDPSFFDRIIHLL